MNPMRKVSRVLRSREVLFRGCCGWVEEIGDAKGEEGDWRDSRTRWETSRRETSNGRSLDDCGGRVSATGAAKEENTSRERTGAYQGIYCRHMEAGEMCLSGKK